MQSNDFMSIAFNFSVANFVNLPKTDEMQIAKYKNYLFLSQTLSNCLKLALSEFESKEVAQNQSWIKFLIFLKGGTLVKITFFTTLKNHFAKKFIFQIFNRNCHIYNLTDPQFIICKMGKVLQINNNSTFTVKQKLATLKIQNFALWGKIFVKQ